MIKGFESLRLYAYLCPAGKWTIGYGHTASALPGQSITPEEAEALFAYDLAPVEKAVSALVTVPLTATQFGALVSFAFNVGIAAFSRSTLLARLNRGHYSAVPGELRRWAHANGKKLPGLVRRREAEIRLWES